MTKLTINRTDFSWTFAAFGAVGLSGLVINQVIATQFGVMSLGRYNMLLLLQLLGVKSGLLAFIAPYFFTLQKRLLKETLLLKLSAAEFSQRFLLQQLLPHQSILAERSFFAQLIISITLTVSKRSQSDSSYFQ